MKVSGRRPYTVNMARSRRGPILKQAWPFRITERFLLWIDTRRGPILDQAWPYIRHTVFKYPLVTFVFLQGRRGGPRQTSEVGSAAGFPDRV